MILGPDIGDGDSEEIRVTEYVDVLDFPFCVPRQRQMKRAEWERMLSEQRKGLQNIIDWLREDIERKT